MLFVLLGTVLSFLEGTTHANKEFTTTLTESALTSVTIEKCLFKDITSDTLGGAFYVAAGTGFTANENAFLRCRAKLGAAAGAVAVAAGTATFTSCLFQDCSVDSYSEEIESASGFKLPIPSFGAVLIAYGTKSAILQTCVFKRCNTTGTLIAGIAGVASVEVKSCKFQECHSGDSGYILGVAGLQASVESICWEECDGDKVAKVDMTSFGFAATDDGSGSCLVSAYKEVEKLDPDYKEELNIPMIVGIVAGVVVVVALIVTCRVCKKKKRDRDSEHPEA